MDLFMQYGIRRVSMDDIAEAAGISKKTIYQLFANKNELVKDVVQAVLQKNSEECLKEQALADNAVQDVFLAIGQMTELFKRINPLLIFDLKKYHPIAYKAYTEFKSEFLYKILKESLERGIQEGLFRNEINTDVVARFRVESILIPFNPEFYNNVKSGIEQSVQELFYLYLYGIVSPKGYKLIEKYKKNKNKDHADY